MKDDNLIIYKNLKPSYDRSGYSSKYRCVPIRKAFDCEEIVLESKKSLRTKNNGRVKP